MTEMFARRFEPYGAMAATLFGALDYDGGDGAHDAAHILRVWRNACLIVNGLGTESSALQGAEPGGRANVESRADLEMLAAAVILHDCVAVEKNHPHRALASRMAAERARTLMAPFAWTDARLDGLAHAIEAHSFSAGLEPGSLEAKILQDADRLDAIGAIGVARCFYVAGRMGSRLYDPADPEGEGRPLNDMRFALDHFPVKLLKLAEGFQTEAGQRLADERTAWMKDFLETFRGEI